MDIPQLPQQEKPKTVKKVTAKKKKIVTLPELQTYVVQPNRVTNSIFDGFTLIQHKAVTAIMLRLQEAVKISMASGDYSQLDLFQTMDKSIQFDLSLKDITSDPTAYGAVKEAIFNMANIGVKIPLKDDKGKLYYFASSLITALIPDKANYKSVITIKIEQTIVKHLIEIDKGPLGLAQNYTRFMYEVAINATSVYTIQVYKLISSWKKKGGFTISYNELRKMLAIAPEKYNEFKYFKKNVLLPAQKDLFEKADCWFNANHPSFKTMSRNKDGEKEIFLNFKVITPELIDLQIQKRKNSIELLVRHFDFKDKDIKEISHILENETIPTDLINRKILKIAESMEANKSIKSKSAYAIKSLLSHNWLED